MESSKKKIIIPLLCSFTYLFIAELNRVVFADINSAVEQNKIIDQFKKRSIKPIPDIKLIDKTNTTKENTTKENTNKISTGKQKSIKSIPDKKLIKKSKTKVNKDEVLTGKQKSIKSTPDKKLIKKSKTKVNKDVVLTGKDTILLNSIDFIGSNVYKNEALVKIFQPLIGKRVTFSELEEYKLKLQSKYRKDGFILARVVIPQQSFKNGLVTIKVIEGYIEDLDIRGENLRLVKYVEKMLQPIKSGNDKLKKIFNFKDFERQVLLIKDIGNVDLVSNLTKGSKLGGAILIVDLDPKPRSLSVFSDSNISDALGDYVLGSSFSYSTKNSNPIKFGGMAKYGFPVKDGVISVLGITEKPIGVNGYKLKALYSYSSTKSKDLFDNSGIQTSEGNSKYYSVGIDYPILLRRDKTIKIGLLGTLQDSYSDLHQDGSKMNNISADKIRALRLNLNASSRKNRSLNNLYFTLSKGFDGLDNNIDSDQFRSNPDGSPNFTTAKLNISRQQYFGKKGFNLKISSEGQLSSDKLYIPEQFSYGGSSFGKGFVSNHLFGDQGWALKGELSKDNFNIKNNRVFTPYIWYDYGQVTNKNEINTSKKAATYGIGIGSSSNKLNFDLGYGIPIFSDIEGTKTGWDNSNFFFNFGMKI